MEERIFNDFPEMFVDNYYLMEYSHSDLSSSSCFRLDPATDDAHVPMKASSCTDAPLQYSTAEDGGVVSPAVLDPFHLISRRRHPSAGDGTKTSWINKLESDINTAAATTEMSSKEMIYRAAVMRPVKLGPESPMKKPRRKNVRISSDPQTVVARQRRERVSDRLRVLQRLVPGGSKMDTATMLDEAGNYLRFLKSQLGCVENHTAASGSSKS